MFVEWHYPDCLSSQPSHCCTIISVFTGPSPSWHSFTWLSGTSGVEYEKESKWITLVPQGLFLKRWNCELSHISNKKSGSLGRVKSFWDDSSYWAGRGRNGEMTPREEFKLESKLHVLLICMSDWPLMLLMCSCLLQGRRAPCSSPERDMSFPVPEINNRTGY